MQWSAIDWHGRRFGMEIRYTYSAIAFRGPSVLSKLHFKHTYINAFTHRYIHTYIHTWALGYPPGTVYHKTHGRYYFVTADSSIYIFQASKRHFFGSMLYIYCRAKFLYVSSLSTLYKSHKLTDVHAGTYTSKYTCMYMEIL